MKYAKTSRRHFLQGTGGALLALPVLPSLMSKAEAQSLPQQKNMVMFFSAHGGIDTSNIFPLTNNPGLAGQMTTTPMYSSVGHNALSGRLTSLKSTRASNLPGFRTYIENQAGKPSSYNQPTGYGLNIGQQDLDNGASRVSPLLGNFISDPMLNKMNLIAGLDMMYDAGHTRGQSGDYANRDGGLTTPVRLSTVDYVLANSGFYGSANPAVKSMMLNCHYDGPEMLDAFFSAQKTAGGMVANTNKPESLGDSFRLLFGSLVTPTTSVSRKTFLLNNVYADYARVTRGAYGPGRRIGSEDRGRLEQFMSFVNDILAGLGGGSGLICAPPNVSPSDSRYIIGGSYNLPVTLANNQTYLDLYNQMIAAAFACGRTNIFFVILPTLRDRFIANGLPGQTFNDSGQDGPGGKIDNTDSHQGIFHQHGLPDRQRYLIESARWYFQHSFYNLMQKLEAMTSPSGGTVLDQSFMFWTQESSFKTHNGWTLPMITAGGAGGSFKTGTYIDYRCYSRVIETFGDPQAFQGVPYNRFLATLLQGMGLSPDKYEVPVSTFAGCPGRLPVTARTVNGVSTQFLKGYGHPLQERFSLVNGVRDSYIYDYQLDDMGTKLPVFT